MSRDALVPSPSFSVSGGGRVEAVADDVREHGGREQAVDLGCHGTRYVPNARGWYAYPVRTVRGALGASRPVRPVTYPTREVGTRSPYVPHGGPGACVSCQLSRRPSRSCRRSTWLARSRASQTRRSCRPYCCGATRRRATAAWAWRCASGSRRTRPGGGEAAWLGAKARGQGSGSGSGSEAWSLARRPRLGGPRLGGPGGRSGLGLRLCETGPPR